MDTENSDKSKKTESDQKENDSPEKVTPKDYWENYQEFLVNLA